MAQITIINGESGLSVRNALNGMFGELYGAIVQPLKQIGISSNVQQAIPVNTYVNGAFISTVSGNPTVRIGTTPNGQDICPDVQPGSLQPVLVQQYFSGGVTLYITISGGTVNIRFDVIQQFY